VKIFDFSSQEEIKKMGHAIECRICVEDPKTMLPAPGTVTAFESTTVSRVFALITVSTMALK
jgi:biotin carboxylase